jgi:transcriptional regulator with XRE-family HTH domain
MSIERFGEKLHTLRMRQGLTQREVAATLGLAAHSYINALETGKKKPTIELVVLIAKLFRTTTDQLLDDALEV